MLNLVNEKFELSKFDLSDLDNSGLDYSLSYTMEGVEIYEFYRLLMVNETVFLYVFSKFPEKLILFYTF